MCIMRYVCTYVPTVHIRFHSFFCACGWLPLPMLETAGEGGLAICTFNSPR